MGHTDNPLGRYGGWKIVCQWIVYATVYDKKNNDKKSFPVSIHSAWTFLYLPLHSQMESAQENPVTDLTGQKCYSSKKLDRSPTNTIENFNSAIYDFFS